jgi:hypothetical protein
MQIHLLLIVLSFLVACLGTNLSKAAELDLPLDERAWLSTTTEDFIFFI